MNDSHEQVLRQLREIDEYEFEHFVADLWERLGWNTTVTQSSADRGIDIVAEKNTPVYQKQVIQAKRYSSGNKVGSPEIQQYSSLRHQENNVDTVVVITTSEFTKQAEEIATDLNIKIISGEQMCGLISDNDAFDLVEQYSGLSENTDISGDVSTSADSKEAQTLTDYNLASSVFEKCPFCDGDEMRFKSENIVCPICGVEFESTNEGMRLVGRVDNLQQVDIEDRFHPTLVGQVFRPVVWQKVARAENSDLDFEEIKEESETIRTEKIQYNILLIAGIFGIAVPLLLFNDLSVPLLIIATASAMLAIYSVVKLSRLNLSL